MFDLVGICAWRGCWKKCALRSNSLPFSRCEGQWDTHSPEMTQWPKVLAAKPDRTGSHTVGGIPVSCLLTGCHAISVTMQWSHHEINASFDGVLWKGALRWLTGMQLPKGLSSPRQCDTFSAFTFPQSQTPATHGPRGYPMPWTTVPKQLGISSLRTACRARCFVFKQSGCRRYLRIVWGRKTCFQARLPPKNQCCLASAHLLWGLFLWPSPDLRALPPYQLHFSPVFSPRVSPPPAHASFPVLLRQPPPEAAWPLFVPKPAALLLNLPARPAHLWMRRLSWQSNPIKTCVCKTQRLFCWRPPKGPQIQFSSPQRQDKESLRWGYQSFASGCLELLTTSGGQSLGFPVR